MCDAVSTRHGVAFSPHGLSESSPSKVPVLRRRGACRREHVRARAAEDGLLELWSEERQPEFGRRVTKTSLAYARAALIAYLIIAQLSRLFSVQRSRK